MKKKKYKMKKKDWLMLLDFWPLSIVTPAMLILILLGAGLGWGGQMKIKRNKLERKLDEYNHTMELVRTILPVMIIILQIIILVKII